MGIVKTGTIQTERYPEESDLKGSAWADRGRKTVPRTGDPASASVNPSELEHLLT